jgi:wyosine [tRNA(Phe)-imidazoG37] synthetase (radical SAM superfamily)
MSYFYGPVPSRRLGFSLGVDLIPKKTCSFDCIYCQLGPSDKKTIKRFFFINLNEFSKSLKEAVKDHPKIDYITLSGSGEPTLHKSLDKIIKTIKKVTKNKYPVCVITNSSLLYRKDVRKELLGADLVIPSLDGATARTFAKINRPHKSITFKKVVNGLIRFRKEFKGEIWLEIMLVGGVNDTIGEAKKFKELVKKIKPDKVQLNLPIRPAEVKVSLPGAKKVKRIKEIICEDVEVVSRFSAKRKGDKTLRDLGKKILRFLKVRPASLEDLMHSFAANPNEIVKELNFLLEKKQIHQKKKYFVIND